MNTDENEPVCEACVRGCENWVAAGRPGDGAEFAAIAHGLSLETWLHLGRF